MTDRAALLLAWTLRGLRHRPSEPWDSQVPHVADHSAWHILQSGPAEDLVSNHHINRQIPPDASGKNLKQCLGFKGSLQIIEVKHQDIT